MAVIKPRLQYVNITPKVIDDVHGYNDKNLAVLHETISGDIHGWSDVQGNVNYLDKINYGIHSVNDLEGHIAWALGLGRAVFYHAGGVNERSIGIEQVSNIPLRTPSNALRRKLWAIRHPQLVATAKTLASWHNAGGGPLKYSDSRTPGVTSHWDVSKFNKSSLGHTDCFPLHKGGYYPILEVISMARIYAVRGYHF